MASKRRPAGSGSGAGARPGGPRTAVLVAAYNQAEPLRLLLAALAAPPLAEFALHIADDGSSPPASEALSAELSRLPFPVTCHWQADSGFRKAEILNTAALAAIAGGAELLVFLDGDCIPRRGLVEVYRAAHRPGEFLVGSVGFLDVATSRALTPETVGEGAHERALELRQRLKIRTTHWKNLLHRGGKGTRPRIRGGNFAVAADLFQAVDGFDEVYGGHGKEDSDLRNRMRNAGARGVSLWHRAIAYHLSREVAPSGARSQAPLPLYREGQRLVRARRGLSAHT